MDKKKILVVEDEKAIADILVFNLQREGYDTLVAYDGAEGLRRALEDAPDLILLDVMLPEMDGFAVLGHIREKQDTPIIMLTAREEETDKVLGLELGADDYITKPFSMRELMARVKANMRRTSGARTPGSGDQVAFGPFSVDRALHTVSKNGAESWSFRPLPPLSPSHTRHSIRPANQPRCFPCKPLAWK